jgi:hypothetical protein
MTANINTSEIYLYNRDVRQKHAEQYSFTQKAIKKIREIALKKIQYPEYSEAYEYVDNLFPSANVKDVIIHKVASRDLEKLGMRGVEGFYDPVTQIVVISGSHSSRYQGNKFYKVEAKIEKDEVIVHELCHYSYYAMGHRSISSQMREEFAYGWSLGYLRQKGYSDEYIIKYNYLPYLMSICNEKATDIVLSKNGITQEQFRAMSKYKKKDCDRRFRKRVFLLSKELAFEKGQNIIDIYSREIESGDYGVKVKEHEEEPYGRYGMLDL